ncbi:hypothetical protein L1987_15101 [Smallanthus sonchifolius]|uniref:Uncharacterized protein n=1 Tax=Smallanthus sonchifolius TaxID=185202 RepID=A0ACB9J5G3_9ASTR|nr:hypothetical protein L1987_15101 [Smallanthus sonchifolius]
MISFVPCFMKDTYVSETFTYDSLNTSFMPISILNKLEEGHMIPTNLPMFLHDQSVRYARGIVEYILDKIPRKFPLSAEEEQITIKQKGSMQHPKHHNDTFQPPIHGSLHIIIEESKGALIKETKIVGEIPSDKSEVVDKKEKIKDHSRMHPYNLNLLTCLSFAKP